MPPLSQLRLMAPDPRYQMVDETPIPIMTEVNGNDLAALETAKSRTLGCLPTYASIELYVYCCYQTSHDSQPYTNEFDCRQVVFVVRSRMSPAVPSMKKSDMLKNHHLIRAKRIFESLTPANILKRKIDQWSKITDDVCEAYHKWYYNNRVFETTKWAGVVTLKSPADMWNYQEIIFELKPQLIIEFGTRYGGSAMFFAGVLHQLNSAADSVVLSVDIDHVTIDARVKANPRIHLFQGSSTAPETAEKIVQMRAKYPGPVFIILDSEHAKDHVLGEMMLLRSLLRKGDYVIVEDGNINGHPVAPGFGQGPYEALEAYFAKFPNDYTRDEKREHKFGFTFAPLGFLIKN